MHVLYPQAGKWFRIRAQSGVTGVVDRCVFIPPAAAPTCSPALSSRAGRLSTAVCQQAVAESPCPVL